MPDPMIAEVERQQRARKILVVAAVIGILASAGLGLGFSLGAFDADGASGPRNPAALIFFVAPFAACMALGGLVYWLARRR